MHIGIPAFAQLLKKIPKARMTVVGSGPDGNRWKTLAKNLGVEDHIDWINWIERKELPKLYFNHNVFLFPSLHDSGGMVVVGSDVLWFACCLF